MFVLKNFPVELNENRNDLNDICIISALLVLVFYSMVIKEGMSWIRSQLVAPCCVLEQDTLTPQSTG